MISEPVIELKDALTKANKTAIKEAYDNVCDLIEDENPIISDKAIGEVNHLLRDFRQYELTKHFAELLINEERNTFETDKHYAQAFIDTNMGSTGLAILNRLSTQPDINFDEYSEAKGMIGRVYKDLFINSTRNNSPKAQKYFNKSIQAYASPWVKNSKKSAWHASNIIALISAAKANNLQIPEGLNAKEIAVSLQTNVEGIPEEKRNYWDWASLAESFAGQGRWEESVGILDKALDKGKATPFQINGTLRQFKEIWRATETNSAAKHMITVLERQLLGKPSGEVNLTVDDIDRQLSINEEDLEALHSHHKMRSYHWVKKYLQRGSNIGSVVDLNSDTQVGTCCVVDGGEIAGKFKGELLCLTNDHVISLHPEEYQGQLIPLHPDEAAIKFTASSDPDKKYRIREIIWSSAYAVHDCCAFRLVERPPIDGNNLPVVDYVPRINPEKPSEIFIISHPEKDALSFSFQNTDLINHDAKIVGKETKIPGRIHYKTPTIKGSSGGVALNASLEMVGLHHAGGELTSLSESNEVYHANEAIWIQSILNALRHDLENGTKRWGADGNVHDQ